MSNSSGPASTLTVQHETALLLWRLYSAQVAQLAIQLAMQAGEEVTRPLTEQQLLRAAEAMDFEAEAVYRMVSPVLSLAS